MPRWILAALVGVLLLVIPATALAAEGCENEARREEQHATYLPDCRAYELVSPAQKNGGDVMADVARTRAAVSGEAAEFASLQGFGDATGTGIATEYLAERTAAQGSQGWGTHAITPHVAPVSLLSLVFGQETLYTDFSPDLSRGVVRSLTPLAADPNVATISNIYMRQDPLMAGTGSYALLSACPGCGGPLTDPLGNNVPAVADTTPDFGQLIFEAKRQLTADAPAQGAGCLKFGGGCQPDLYESDHGTLRFVGLIPPSGTAECGQTGGPACEAAASSMAGPGAKDWYTPNTISADGSKVFFTVPPTGGSASELVGALYMRVDHTRTVQLNASERTDCADHDPCTGAPEPDPAGPQPALYETASRDGSKVFFKSSEQLTDTTGGDLYVYDTTLPATDPNRLRHVFIDEHSAGATSEARGVVASSNDGSYLYFMTNSAILPNQPDLPTNSYGLYVWHEGTVHLVGSVDNEYSALAEALPDDPTTSYAARVTPDGRTLLFTSFSGVGLTGYPQGHTCKAVADGNGPCPELYLYKADTGTVHCVSCNPAGAEATAEAGFRVRESTGAALTTHYLNHPLSDDGEHVFFETGERLLPQDINGQHTDVYEWTAVGAGGCGEASAGFSSSAGGCLSLLSKGVSDDDSHFLDATPSGKDVFFSTDERLLGWDSDNSYDLYDARIAGGLPEPPAPAASCAGDVCQGPFSAPSTANLPESTQVFHGSESAGGAPRKRQTASTTKAQKLAKVLRACRKRHGRGRKKCEAAARKRFGARRANKSGGGK